MYHGKIRKRSCILPPNSLPHCGYKNQTSFSTRHFAGSSCKRLERGSMPFDAKLDWNDPFISEVLLNRNRRTDINIVFDNSENILYEKQPKYNIIEVMSNIGGFLGMWMGVSMIAILNLFEILLTIFFFCIKRRKNKKRPTVIYIA
ncbi:hypothetical protein TNCT_35691 [Trichonephila clavata]|uniref:Uncharacterized protein n=1 Tax=Trichonephila clavata TaxID=2740835 RepID=A0A8X6FUR1_TRICU|nr:hypothetical protein TNCT_35691 [Trichonephila clavata]